MEKEYKFRSSPPIATFKKYSSKSVNKLIRHNFRIGIPENVNSEFTKYNFYYIGDKKARISNEKGFELTNNKRIELLKKIEEDWNKQQQKYSEAQKSTFKDFCNKHNTYIEVVLPATRQEWFEKMGLCQFTDIQVWDKITDTRKMGQLIPESTNWDKLNEWVNIEINFMKQWMKNNLKTDMGYLYSAVHMDETTPHIHFCFIPISEVFSKKLNKERYIISNNRIFGGKKQLQKFNNYHANYLTKLKVSMMIMII